MRSIPQVTGPTESALGALLDRQLASSRIPGRLAWITINAVAVDAAAVDSTRGALEALVDAQTRCGLAAAANAVARLVSLGLLDDEGRLTADGDAELLRARRRVAAASARLVEGLSEADLATTIAVLDHVRGRAEEQLST